MTDYKQTRVWRDALKLARRFYSLSEDLPENEWGMASAMRELASSIPGEIAVDLVKGNDPRLEGVLRASAMLELIDQIYPALDTATAQKSIDALLERMQSQEKFAETATESS